MWLRFAFGKSGNHDGLHQFDMNATPKVFFFTMTRLNNIKW